MAFGNTSAYATWRRARHDRAGWILGRRPPRRADGSPPRTELREIEPKSPDVYDENKVQILSCLLLHENLTRSKPREDLGQ
ncbi:hypothetical protein GUJ93_ZPchr0010g9019 [Zizania palustris]|uniref:Uncharacterized protein n=1 Tax=Zizania palustris TaxID=103762 RepID=A0A8J6BFZ6_ZIZPA|nr:hypothetical protein GUJ93_ZPchr0010g9019 [Zizania palustris]